MNSPNLNEGTETIDTKYKTANKLLLEIREQLEKLESEEDNSVIQQGRVSSNLNNLARTISQLENMVLQQPISKRELWKM